jgi:hypothetical protein
MKVRRRQPHDVDIVKKRRGTQYMRNDAQELILAVPSSKSTLFLKNNVERLLFFKQVDGDIYPDKDLPEKRKKT